MRARIRNYESLWLAVFVGMVLLLPAILGRTGISREPFDPTPLVELQSLSPSPEVVLIGDSMLGTRIDPETMDACSNVPVFVNILEGSASARWYLYLKNYLAESNVQPKHVVIFFRDRYLTDPVFRTSAQYQEWLHAAMKPDEPVVDRLLKGQDTSRFAWLAKFFEWLYPSQQLREQAADYMVSRAQKLTEHVTSDGTDFDVALDRTFDIDLLRKDMPSELASENLNREPFDPSPEKSFLPHMLDLARANGWHLTFYRVKRRPLDGDIRTDEPELVEYIADLKTYLQANGADLVDVTNDESIGIEFYSDGDHVSEAMRPRYTEKFFERNRGLFE